MDVADGPLEQGRKAEAGHQRDGVLQDVHVSILVLGSPAGPAMKDSLKKSNVLRASLQILKVQSALASFFTDNHTFLLPNVDCRDSNLDHQGKLCALASIKPLSHYC